MEAAFLDPESCHDLVVIYFGSQTNNEQLKKLIPLFSWDRIINLGKPKEGVLIKAVLGIWTLFFLRRTFRNYAEKLFIGDFRFDWMSYARCAIRPARTILLDDGAATVTVHERYFQRGIYWPETNHKGLKGLVKKLLYTPYYDSHIASTPIDVFTCYNLRPSRSQVIIKNEYSLLKKKTLRSAVKNHQAFYLGSKYSEAKIMSLANELFFLKLCFEFYLRRNVNVSYIPHRDDSPEKLDAIKKLGVEIRHLGVPAEIYFSTTTEMPLYVGGAYTSALNNLKKMFEELLFHSFVLPPDLLHQNHQENVASAYNNVQRDGIELVYIENYIQGRAPEKTRLIG